MISTLPSLSGQSAKEVEGILANLTLEMLPNPGISEGENSGLTPDLRNQLIHEIRVRLRLKRDDNSPQAMSRIYDYLAKEIGRVALAGVDIKDVKNRLGQRGDLATSLYKIEFTQAFKDLHEKRGVERRDVERTLQNPDSVEHLRPDLLGIDANKAKSIYLKEFKNIQHPLNTYSLLVFCNRDGYVQRVSHAWLFFHSDVDLSKVGTPVDVLKALVDKYGLEIMVGQKRGRFFWYEHVPVSTQNKTNFLEVAKLEPGINFAVVLEVGSVINNILQIICAFAINDTAYEEDLKKHGIRMRE